MTRRDELVNLLRDSGAELPANLADDAPLISSGLLDSTALFDLVGWIEDRAAAPIDLTEIDLAVEWNTIAAILDFVDRHGGGAQ